MPVANDEDVEARILTPLASDERQKLCKRFGLARRIDIVLDQQIRRKEIDMAVERRWGKWDGPQPPEGEGGLGSGSPPSGGSEAEGKSRQFVAVCFKCGATSYIGGDWKWFTCWKCGAMSQEMVA